MISTLDSQFVTFSMQTKKSPFMIGILELKSFKLKNRKEYSIFFY